MIVVHHLEHSRSHRILWLLEELALPYELIEYKRDPQTMLAPPALKRVHPLGKSPVITDNGQVIAESGAIVEYLLDRYGEGRFRPAHDSPDLLRYRYWLHYAEGSAMPLLVMKLVFNELPRQAPWIARPVLNVVRAAVGAKLLDPQLEQHAAFWEDHLVQHAYMAGEQFTAADIQMSYPVDASLTRISTRAPRPATFAYMQRLRERPAYQRALLRGGAPIPGA